MAKKTAICLSLLAAALAISSLSYAGNPILVYYWEPDGSISEQSKDNAMEMRNIAKEQGYVTLWLVLNYPFNVYFDEMTPEEIAEQQQNVALGFEEILDPLVASGDVWHRTEGPFIKGPGIAVRATDKGLRSLLRDDRILQISAAHE